MIKSFFVSRKGENMKQLNTNEYEELLNKLKENTLSIKLEVDNLLSNSCCEYHRVMFGISSNPKKRKEWQEKVYVANKVKAELEQAIELLSTAIRIDESLPEKNPDEYLDREYFYSRAKMFTEYLN